MKKQIIFRLFHLLAVFFFINVQAYDFKINGLCYNKLSGNEVEVVDNASSYSGDIVLPEFVNYYGTQYKVVKIGEMAFQNCTQLLSIVIPNSILNIGKKAFAGCSNLRLIMSLLKNPADITNDTFYGLPSDCIIYVNEFDAYKYDKEGWNSIPQIRSIMEGSSIYDIEIDTSSGVSQVMCFGDPLGEGEANRIIDNSGELPFYMTCNSNSELDALIIDGQDVTENVGGNEEGGYHYSYRNTKGPTYVRLNVWVLMSNKTSVTFTTDGGGEIGCVYYDTRYSLYVTSTTKSIGYASVSKWRSIDVVLVPDAGNILKKLIVNNEDVTSNVTNNRYSITDVPLKNITCEATFDQEQAPDDNVHKLTLSATGGGEIGQGVYGKRNGSIDFYFTHGSSVTIWANPDDGYRLSKLTVDGRDVTSSVKNHQYTISSMEKDIKCEATFEQEQTDREVTLSLKSNGYGSLSYGDMTVSSGSQSRGVKVGTDVTVKITPNSGYKLKTLMRGNTDVTNDVANNQYTIKNIQSSVGLTATFEQDQTAREVTLSLKSNGNGSLSYGDMTVSSGSQSRGVKVGTDVTVIITPNSGYKLKTLMRGNTDVTNDVVNSQYTIKSIQSSVGLTATFEQGQVTPSEYTLTLTAGGGGSIGFGQYGTSGSTIEYSVAKGTNVTIWVVPDEGKKISKLTVDGKDVTASVKNNQYTIGTMTKNISCVATFEVMTYSLTLKSNGNGKISYSSTSVTTGSKSVNVVYGADATINIQANSGCRLGKLTLNGTDVTDRVQWSDGMYYMIKNIKENNTVEATFEKRTYTLTLSSDGHGSLSWGNTSVSSGSKSVEVEDGTDVAITILSDSGYRLKKLSVDGSDMTYLVNNNQYVITDIDGHHNVNASFEVIPPTNYTLTLKSSGNGSISYNGTSVSGGSKSIEVAEGTNVTLTMSPNNGYRLSKLLVNNSDVTASVQNNQYTVQNIRNDVTVEASFEVIPPTKYTLTLKSNGNGAVAYGSVSANGGSESASVVDGTNVTVTLTPSSGYKLEKLTVSGSEVTAKVQNNQYSFKITANTIVEAWFAAITTTFSQGGVNYSVASQTNKTVSITGGKFSGNVSIPESVSQDGQTWKVTQLGNGALKNQTGMLTLTVPQSISSVGTGLFEGCTNLAAITWNASVPLTDERLGNVANPNMLVYVKSQDNAPSKIQNVVVNGTAQKIVLKDASSGNNFYCPSAFTAKTISYTHNYGMKSGKGDCRGWETLALPFDVQKVSHASKGVLTPFALFKDADKERPFWLYEWTTGGWNAAQAIKANTPYIISMPNHDDYDNKYRLAGDVTFSAENAKVNATISLQQNAYGGKTLVPCFVETAQSSGYYALNVNNSVTTYTGSDAEGSVFVRNLRKVHPFEAYLVSEGSAAKFGVFDDMTPTDIPELPSVAVQTSTVRVYSLSGQLLRTKQNCRLSEAMHGLPRGVYVVNGKRVIIEKD